MLPELHGLFVSKSGAGPNYYGQDQKLNLASVAVSLPSRGKGRLAKLIWSRQLCFSFVSRSWYRKEP